MNLPPDLQFMMHFIKPFILTPDWFSLLRTFLWFTFFVITLHFVVPSTEPKLPYSKEMKSAGLTPLATTPSDPRFARLDIKKLEPQSITWVAGSSIAIKPLEESDYTYLPAEVQQHLPDNMRSYVSLKMGLRLLDNYTLTLDAIKRQPDAMVITLNPFWTLNDTATFFKMNVMNSGAGLWTNKTDWPLFLLLASPGNMLWNVAGKEHKLIGNGYDYLKILVPQKIQNKKKEKKKAENPKPLQGRQKVTNETTSVKNKLSYNKPIIFWIDQRFETDQETQFAEASVWQEKIMMYQNVSESFLAKKLLENLFQNIKNSHIPTLLYIPPVSSDLKDTKAYDNYQKIADQIKATASKYEGENIYFIGDFPENILKTMEFTDHLHLKNSGKLPEFLGKEISAIMDAKEVPE